MAINGKNVKEIHKEIYKLTLKVPKMYLFMSKVANKAVKNIDRRKKREDNSDILLVLFAKMDYNGKIKKVINHNLMENAEKAKQDVINNYINSSESAGKWIYLASSHNDCAKDHKPYQGKLYYDDKAPQSIINWAKNKGLNSIQWVMSEPAYFITRPNCRHFFVSLPLDTVRQYSMSELKSRYKTHRMTGDRTLQTPKDIVVEEYRDKLDMLQKMQNEYPSEQLQRKIEKIKLLLKKWENKL